MATLQTVAVLALCFWHGAFMSFVSRDSEENQ